jgi:hypothetical protein
MFNFGKEVRMEPHAFAKTSRVQLWSCGGGRQSAGIAALIVQGRLPKPDHARMVRLEWEADTVWPYVDACIRPAMERLGVPFTVIERAEFATKGMWGGEDGDTLLIPSFTNQSGRISKFAEYCSGEWKREVGNRWACAQPGWKEQGVDVWLGISADERKRRQGTRRLKWISPVYPLLDWLPMHVSSCLEAVRQVGWPEPPRSRCRHCPNQSDAEWADLSPADFEAACQLDDEIRTVDPNVWLHKKCIPLRVVKLESKKEVDLFGGGCTAGMCY